MLKKLKKLSQMMLPLAVLTLSAETYAKSEVINADRFTAEVAISRLEQNLIEIQGRRISSVIPSIAGALTYHKDDENGVLYFTLANDQHMGTISMFVNDDQGGRYRLILVPSNQGAQEIILVPPSSATKEKTKPTNEAHIAMIKQLMTDMANHANGTEISDDIQVTQVNENIPLWHEAQLILLYKFDTEELTGESYQITNQTKVVLQLREQEFYRNNVYAISVSKLTLEPNETAFVYIVRGKE
ncbi:conjugal transfer protein TraK [Moraxella catarrhalis]|uniref:TraK domain-containing protein n=1 Tax=Moraxella catarrhalis TaxID=480 RepID=UPI00128CB30D|nr:type-F conjugative transfer system secretin TraK [Moraxella catarrhalis]MPX16882.1 conjugal transfer protein TraK [Moraxella catarrhalis]